jgi:3D (Asp-Asp-Asp) domain-containing protein
VLLAALVAAVLHLASAHPAACTAPPTPHLITHRAWVSGFTVTEYYPAPERWFTGALVAAPGLSGRHRVDWLYSARGLSMEGDGVDVLGHPAHIDALGSVGWVDAAGRATVPPRSACSTHWSAGPPAWRSGGWRNRSGAVTFPLLAGGWSNGSGHWVGDYGGATFAAGTSSPLHYWQSAAVDPRLIPRGSRMYVPAFHRWFVADDVGGAILGRHLDLYRPPPASPSDLGVLLTDQRVLVAPPGS